MALGKSLLLLFGLVTATIPYSWENCPDGKEHVDYPGKRAVLLQVAANSKLNQRIDEANPGEEFYAFQGTEMWPTLAHSARHTLTNSHSLVQRGSLQYTPIQLGSLLVVGVAASIGLKFFIPGSNALRVVGLGSLYIACSVTMIESNKWLMIPGHFPYPVALTTNHMLMSFFLANCLRCACPTLFPSWEGIKVTRAFVFSLILIGTTFALSIVCANAAYKYMSVPFLQCMKQGNIGIIYFFSVLVGLEALRRSSIVLLTFTLSGTLLAIHGELHFQLIGFLLQIVSSLSEASKIIMQGLLMSGSDKLDPLTLVLCMAPACLLACIVPLAVIDLVQWNEFYTQLMLHWPLILMNSCLAFALNVVVAQCIKQLSPVGYLLCGIVKDVTLIVSSSLLLGESLSALQIAGFSIALSGVALYSLYKQNQDCFEDDSVIDGFARVTKRLCAKNDRIEDDA